MDEERSFKSKLEFIKSIFSEKYPPDLILSGSIQHKLNMSLEQYEWDAQMSANLLSNKEALTILKKLDREE